MNKEKQTYKTKHPSIKEISIGDKFILNNGEIVTFVKFDAENKFDGVVYPYIMEYNSKNTSIRKSTFNLELKYLNIISNNDIKERYITLKDKVDLL